MNSLFKKTAYLLLLLLGFTVQAKSQVVAVNDTIKTGPSQKVKFDVTQNDSFTCNTYTLSVTGVPPSNVGTATFEGDFLVFTPAPGVTNQTVTVGYTLTCQDSQSSAATVYIMVGANNLPINVIQTNDNCIDPMPSSVAFGVREKYIARSPLDVPYPNDKGLIQSFQIPLVGDIDGDGKPEIVVAEKVDNNRTNLNVSNNYIRIFDGQDGSSKFALKLNSLGYGYGAKNNDYDKENGFKTGEVPWHQSPSYLALADVDRDGIGEIIVCQTMNEGKIYCLKPVLDANKKIIDLEKIWDGERGIKAPISASDPIANNDFRVYGQPSPQIVDINGDGIPEVVVYNKIYNAQTGALLMSWGKSSATPKKSTLYPDDADTDGLFKYNEGGSDTDNVTTSLARATVIRNHAMVGRRPAGSDPATDAYLAIPAIVDIDDDGVMEVVTGTRIHKFQLTNTNGQAGNTYTTIEGPDRVTVKTGSNYQTNTTYYLNDGFTRVADIDGDNKLDFVVMQNARGHYGDVTILIYVWNYDPDTGTSVVKAASTIFSNGEWGQFGIPFIGDVNDRLDGRDVVEGEFTKKLPEIIFTAGLIDRTPAAGRTGAPVHPESDFSNFAGGGDGHIVAFTYDGGETEVYKRLKLSWVLGHQDNSNNTGITMFDFNNDGAFDLCYRDINSIRIISPKVGSKATGTDFIPYDKANAGILFKYSVSSETGFEAPAIADVNLDGSADIVVTGFKSRTYTANVYVFEREDGQPQWAPCPPVWNQAMYNPLYINEDLTVPAKPLSMLTTYTDGEGQTIRPYNGSWIQQPIVREGDAYVPIYRHPDAVLDDMEIERVDASNIRVRVTIRNEGLASINASTPIYLYQTEPGSSIKENIHTPIPKVGVDIFPGEKVTLNYIMAGAMGMYVHCRIVDNGTSFPAAGFTDCDLTNNYGFLPIIRANNDSYTVNRQSETTLAVVANDSPIGNVSLEVVQQPQYGTATVDGDKLIYTATHATAERDTLRYVLKCEDGSFTTTDTAYVYVVITNHVLPDNVITGTGSDCVVPFAEIEFDVQQKWHSPTNTAYSTTSPLVGDLDGDGIPEAVTIGYPVDSLYVLNGNDGSWRYSMRIPSAAGSEGWTPVINAALVDSDGNGMGEIIFAGSDLSLTSYEADTTGGVFSLVQKWQRLNAYENLDYPDGVNTDKLPQPFVADFNNDGVPEVVVYNRIFNAQTGALLGSTEADVNTAYVGRVYDRHSNAKSNFLTAADFDGDGKLELAAGGKIYKVDINPAGTVATCSILYQVPSTPSPLFKDGFTSVADLDLDGKLDVVVMDFITPLARINIWSPTTGQVQQILIPNSSYTLGYPFIGDIDGEAIDGKRYPEICVVTQHLVAGLPDRGKVNAYKYDPVTQQFVSKWEFLNSDASGGTGITLFDFNADGISELVYRDQDSIRILDGRLDGVAPTLSGPNAKFYCTSGTAFEYPVIVDADGSGSAKICVTCANNGVAGITHTLNVFESNTETTTPWAPTRKVWNQVNYEPTLINNDLTVTRYPFPKHTPFEVGGETYYPYNGALIQVPIMDLNLEPVVNSADPYAVSLHATQLSPTTVRVSVVVGNQGYVNVSSDLPVTLYAGSIAVANVIATKPLDVTLAPGATATVTFDIPSEELPTVLVARVQDNGMPGNPAASAYNDCNLDNNTASLRVLLALDDFISPEKDKPITVNVVANDVLGLCDENNIEVAIDGSPSPGTVVTVLPNGSISYTPAAGFVGTDTFTYTITCGSESSTATVTAVVNSTLMVEKVGSDASESGTLGQFRIKFTDAGFTFSKALEVSYVVTAVNADAGVDYIAPSGTVILPANTPSVDVTIAPINNFMVEGNNREVTLTITGITVMP